MDLIEKLFPLSIPNLLQLIRALPWTEKLPVINWLLESADEALLAHGYLKTILADTDRATELKAIHELVDVLHPVYWNNPFRPGDPKIIEAKFLALGPNPGLPEIATLVPAAAEGSRLKNVAKFLLEYADEAVAVLLTLLALVGRKQPVVPKLT